MAGGAVAVSGRGDVGRAMGRVAGQVRDCGWRMGLPRFLWLRWGGAAGQDRTLGGAAGGDKNPVQKNGAVSYLSGGGGFLSFLGGLSDERSEEFAAVDRKPPPPEGLETAHFCRQVSVYGQEIPRQATQGVSQNTMQN